MACVERETEFAIDRSGTKNCTVAALIDPKRLNFSILSPLGDPDASFAQLELFAIPFARFGNFDARLAGKSFERQSLPFRRAYI